jgi:hypothetical protein
MLKTSRRRWNQSWKGCGFQSNDHRPRAARCFSKEVNQLSPVTKIYLRLSQLLGYRSEKSRQINRKVFPKLFFVCVTVSCQLTAPTLIILFEDFDLVASLHPSIRTDDDLGVIDRRLVQFLVLFR